MSTTALPTLKFSTISTHTKFWHRNDAQSSHINTRLSVLQCTHAVVSGKQIAPTDQHCPISWRHTAIISYTHHVSYYHSFQDNNNFQNICEKNKSFHTCNFSVDNGHENWYKFFAWRSKHKVLSDANHLTISSKSQIIDKQAVSM